MKILHIVRQFHPVIGGLENYVFNLAAQQINTGHNVTVLTLNRNFSTNEILVHRETHSNGIEIIRIPYILSKKYPVALSVFKYLRGHDIINVHALDFFADFIALSKVFHGKKIVLITHGGFFHTRWAFYFKKLYFHTVTRLILNFYDAVIGCSDNDIDQFKKVTSKIQLIYNGVNIKPFLSIDKKINKGELLYVGRLDSHKRIENLIKLIAHLRQKEKVFLNLVGPDSINITENLKTQAKKLNVIEHIGFIGSVSEEELIRYFSKAHVFVSASEYEGFGISAVEAMASGTPCVLNKIKSFETLLNNKSFGTIADFNNTTEASKSIIGFLNKTDRSLKIISEEARQFSKNFDWEKVSLDFEKIYRSI